MKCVVAVGASLGALFSVLNSGASAFSTSPAAFSRTREGCVGCRAARWGMWGKATKAAPAPVSPVALGLQEKLRKLGTDKSEPDREARIQQLAEELNQLNPTKDPAFSPLLAGRWRMIYSNVPGPSSGRLGPFVGDVFQDIRPDEKKIENILELGPSWALRGALEADVEVLDGKNWAIIFDRVYNNFAGVQVQEKAFDKTERRIWNMTYLDEGFRVLYGRQESTPAEEGYIFVLERDPQV